MAPVSWLPALSSPGTDLLETLPALYDMRERLRLRTWLGGLRTRNGGIDMRREALPSYGGRARPPLCAG